MSTCALISFEEQAKAGEAWTSLTNITNTVSKLACSTVCLPGSEAERKELERIAEFQRAKAEREAEAALNKPERDAERIREYEAATEANRALMRKKRTT
jgi:hypothetical protein